MNNRIFRTLIYTFLLGAGVFIMPLFILKVITFLIIAGLLIRLFIYSKIHSISNSLKNMDNNKTRGYKVQTIEIEAKTIHKN